MRKKIFYLIILLLFTLLLLALNGCRSLPEELSTPENIRIEKRTVYWDAVENATEYVVKINDSEYTVSDCSFPIYMHTADGGSYQIEVMACACEREYSDSSFAKINAYFEATPLHAYDESGYEYTLLKDKSGYEISLGKNTDIAGSIVIPASFCDYPVKRIANYAFHSESVYSNEFTESQCNLVTTGILLPDCLESIGLYAFAYMVRLEEIVIPDSVTTIEDRAFLGCTHLKKVKLPEGLKSIPDYCFRNTALEELVLPTSLETIGKCAFQCEYRPKETYGYPIEHIYSRLSRIVIPNSVKRIGTLTFAGREMLSTIVWSDTVEWLDARVFENTQWYEAQPDGFVMLGFFLYQYKGEIPDGKIATIPAEVKLIAGGAFQGQKTLHTIVIADGIQLAGGYTFNGCENLTEVILPKGLTQIPEGCFSHAVALKSISLPETVTYIGMGAFAGSGLEHIDIPSSVKEIGDRAFNACTALSDIHLSEALEQIGSLAFGKCSVVEIVLPSSLKILKKCFESSPSLSHIFYTGTEEMLSELIELEDSNHSSYYFLNATIYYYSEEAPTYGEKFWHYVNGIPTAW